MEWSRHIATIAGIPIRIHLTLPLVAVWILLAESRSFNQQLIELATFLGLFLCILLHELGHSLVAQRLRIRTRDITLYPFGGIASLLDRVNPRQEVLITIAGPAVNILIACAIVAMVGTARLEEVEFWSSTLAGRMLAANILLASFNMLPAFPMDGGRLLRATLALFKVPKANLIAVRLSQVVSILLATVALMYSHILLLVIAILVFLNASRELVSHQIQRSAAQLKVGQVTVPLSALQPLTPGLTLQQASDMAVRSLQAQFPVILGDAIVGLVDRATLLERVCLNGSPGYVTEIMFRDLPVLAEGAAVDEAVGIFEQSSAPAALVMNGSIAVGLVFREQLGELLVVHDVTSQPKDDDPE